MVASRATQRDQSTGASVSYCGGPGRADGIRAGAVSQAVPVHRQIDATAVWRYDVKNCNWQNPRRLLRPGVEDMICGAGKLLCSSYWKGVELEQELRLEVI